MDSKIRKLKAILKTLKRVAIAYSGGLDSTFLLKIAVDTLGRDNVLAITARSETYPASEYKEAVKLAKKIGARQVTIRTQELKIGNFKSNPVNRCYYCKKELFKKLDAIKERRGMNCVLDGTNYDDLKDIRHGRKAAWEFGVRSPLLESKLTKADIRKYSRRLKLPTWDKPSFACLASRIPFNSAINEKDLRRIDTAETYLRKLGFRQMRVRVHGDIARLEIYKKDFRKILNEGEMNSMVKKLKNLGFKYVALDLEGYRTGSMHEV